MGLKESGVASSHGAKDSPDSVLGLVAEFRVWGLGSRVWGLGFQEFRRALNPKPHTLESRKP